MSVAQNCSLSSSCTSCVAAGCHYCQAYSRMAVGGCYPSTSNAGDTNINCNGANGDQADKFITSGDPTECFGGCSTGNEYCTQCSSLYGCGWCWDSGKSGCFKQSNGGAPASCGGWTQGNCIVPCVTRTDCQQCLDQSLACTWIAKSTTGAYAYKNGTCYATASAPTTGTVINDAKMCPAQPVPSAATSISLFFAAVLTLSVAFM